jgi:hypothetical protein
MTNMPSGQPSKQRFKRGIILFIALAIIFMISVFVPIHRRTSYGSGTCSLKLRYSVLRGELRTYMQGGAEYDMPENSLCTADLVPYNTRLYAL